MGGSYLVVGTFFGIQLRIDYSWFFIFALIAWTVITSYLPSYNRDLSSWVLTVAGLIVTVLFFLSVILHEYAHSIVANRRGLRVKRITLFFFGGASELQHEPTSAKTELLMTAAGPLTSLAIAGIFAGLGIIARNRHITALDIIFQPVAALNFVVGVFNLLPAFPLDGGRLLRSVLWLIRKDFTAATRNATNTGIGLAYLMIAFGVAALLAGNPIGGLWLAIIGFFLMQSARLSYAQTVAQNILSGVKVSDIFSEEYVAVPLGTTIDSFLSDYVMRYKQYDFLVTDETGNPVGIIETSRLSRNRRRDNQRRVDDYMQPLAKNQVLKPSDPATKVWRIMQSHNLDILPVMAQQTLLGVVMRRYLDDYVVIHRLRGSKS